MVSTLVDNPWLYNSHADIWVASNVLDKSLTNNKRIGITDDAIERMCGFIYLACDL